MRIELDEGLVNEAVSELAATMESLGLTEGLQESEVSVAVDAGIREHVTRLAVRELLDLGELHGKVAFDDIEPVLVRRFSEIRDKKRAAVSVT